MQLGRTAEVALNLSVGDSVMILVHVGRSDVGYQVQLSAHVVIGEQWKASYVSSEEYPNEHN